jgi:hypothetical protein
LLFVCLLFVRLFVYLFVCLFLIIYLPLIETDCPHPTIRAHGWGVCVIWSRGEGRSYWSKIAPRSTHDHVGLVAASSTGHTSNGQPDVEDFKAGSMGKELSAVSGPG